MPDERHFSQQLESGDANVWIGHVYVAGDHEPLAFSFRLGVSDCSSRPEACGRSSRAPLMYASSLPTRSSPVKNPARHESADQARIYKARILEGSEQSTVGRKRQMSMTVTGKAKSIE